jgi:hypothetical protein
MSAEKCTAGRVQGSGFRVQFFAPSRDQTWSRFGRADAVSRLVTPYSVLSTQCCRCAASHRASSPLLLLLLLAPAAVATAAESFADKLSALAAKCDELGLKEQAALTRAWNIQRYPGRQYLFLPLVTDPTVPKAGAPETATQWHKRFLELRREHAADLFGQAKAASDQNQPTRAYQLLYEVLREDADHAEARRIVGYIEAGGLWRLPEWEKATPRQPPLNHPKLGWRAGSYRSLDTPHFQIVSNHSANELLEAGRELENLHTLWRQIFFRYWSTPQALAARFAGGKAPLSPERPKMQVVLFQSQKEYAAYVAAAHPKAATTLGLYNDKEHISYFFGGDTSVYPTWYHEATHQLFQEAVPGASNQPGQQRNFWALEGAALYMESLANRGTFWTAGGCESDRLQFARYRALSGEQLPLARLTALSRDEIQNSDEIGRIYTQAAGLAHFLIDGADGKYREALTDLLSAIYRGEDTADSLEKFSKQPLPKLDEQYRDFLDVTDDDVAGIPDPTTIRNLSFCRTRVSDKGLARFAATKNLKWLDLSFTAATDDGLKNFARNRNLRQLFLEGTQITAGSLPLIGTFTQLEELDLSRLPIGDNDLAPLRSLKRLTELNTDHTQITPDGLKKLRTALPKLK